jgi:hypothetical protein
MMKNPGGGYQQKFQRLPKRPEISNKNIKKSPAGPATNARGGDMSDYNLKENVSYQTPDDQLYPDNGFTAPPEVYTMNVGPPIKDQINYGEGDGAGEFVQVVCRIRPMLQFEMSRGDDNCIKVLNEQDLQLNKGYSAINFQSWR